MVEFKVKLNILSKEEFIDLQRDTMQLESLSRRQTVAKAKITKSGGIFGGEGQGNLPSSIIKKRRQAELSRITDASLANKVKTAVDQSLVSGAGAPIQKANAFKALQKEVSINTKAMGAMQKGLGGFMQFRGLAMGGTAGLWSAGMGLVSKVLPIGIAIAVASQVFQIWKDTYGAGGINDIRKLILDDVTSVIGLERETAIISGRQFFANSRTLKMGQDYQTNTADLTDGYYRTRLLRSGYNRS